MQVLIFIVLLAGCTVAIQQGTNNNGNKNRAMDYTFGTIAGGSIISSGIARQNFRFGQVVTYDYVYTAPTTGTAPVIEAVIIKDLKRRNGASAEIVGGVNVVGQTAVTIRFTSKRGFGIYSRVEIYGQ